MDNQSSQHGGCSFIASITNFLSKGWEMIASSSSARCEAYSAQANYAQEEMKKDNISRKDRRFWAKQKDKAMNGLAEIHRTNSETFVKAICAIGAGLLIGNKLLNNKK